MGRQGKQWLTLFFGGSKNHCRWCLQPWNSKMLTHWKESDDQPRQHIKKHRHYFANKVVIYFEDANKVVHLVKAMVFPVVMYGYELDCKESWAPKNWCFWTVVLENTLESPLDCKEIQPVHPKGDQSWIIIGRTDAEAEAPVLWPPDEKSWLIWKDPDAGKDWGQEEKGQQDEMVCCHHWLNGHRFAKAPGICDGQEHLVCSGLWCYKESDTTERLNWTELKSVFESVVDQLHFKSQRCYH